MNHQWSVNWIIQWKKQNLFSPAALLFHFNLFSSHFSFCFACVYLFSILYCFCPSLTRSGPLVNKSFLRNPRKIIIQIHFSCKDLSLPDWIPSHSGCSGVLKQQPIREQSSPSFPSLLKSPTVTEYPGDTHRHTCCSESCPVVWADCLFTCSHASESVLTIFRVWNTWAEPFVKITKSLRHLHVTFSGLVCVVTKVTVVILSAGRLRGERVPVLSDVIPIKAGKYLRDVVWNQLTWGERTLENRAEQKETRTEHKITRGEKENKKSTWRE